MAALANAPRRQKGNARIIILVGLPGSGKSTFALSLQRAGWHVISSDLLRAKKGQFDEEIGVASKPSMIVKQPIVVDRCNVAPDERQRLLQLMHSPLPSDILLVFFDKSLEDCCAEVTCRVGHPTISGNLTASTSRKIIEGFSRRLVAPAEAEGFGSIEVVTSHDNSDELLRSGIFGKNIEPAGQEDCIGGGGGGGASPTLYRFPRTPHLMDVGGSGKRILIPSQFATISFHTAGNM